MNCQAPLKPEAIRATAGIATSLGLSSEQLRKLGQSLPTAKAKPDAPRTETGHRFNPLAFNPDCPCCQWRRAQVAKRMRDYYNRKLKKKGHNARL